MAIPVSTTTQQTSPLHSFNGTIAPTKTGLLYNAGLAVVAFAMVLLPFIYISLIVLAAWGVVYHLMNNTWIFEGGSGRGGLVRLIFYLGPALAGAILVFFMIKPFFAAKAKEQKPITLDPTKEALLFAFVGKICGLVGAPMPCRIDVDCQVNASASLRKGFLSKDLVLTIGLPLVSGLDMRQFAGVLAHEFGHFAQGAGMRFTYVIRKINFWFARVVYERDEWDVKLEESAKGIDWRIGVVLHAARGCVWLTRRVLWALMHLGHAISCFMLRQMEYDADSYEAKLAGSDAFASTASRLGVLNVATQFAFEDVRQSWTSNRLPENLPLLIDHKAGSLPAEIHQKLSASAEQTKTGWFDTHPCDADRVRAVRKLKEPGIFQVTEPSTRLFSDFSELSKEVTRYHYERNLALKFTEQNLMSADEILRESAAMSEADSMIRKYYGTVNISLKPLLTPSDVESIATTVDTSAWREARNATEALRTEAEKISADCAEAHSRIAGLISARHLAKAGFTIKPEEFELPGNATSPGEQEIASKHAIEQTSATLSARFAQLEPFSAALRTRASMAVNALHNDEKSPEKSDELSRLARLTAAVGAEMPRAHEIGSRISAFTILAQNRGNHANPAEVDATVSQLMSDLKGFTGGIQERLKNFSYPFTHARGQVNVAEYLRADEKGENEWHRVYLESSAHVDRLFALNYRLIGKILAAVDAAEKNKFGTNEPTDKTQLITQT